MTELLDSVLEDLRGVRPSRGFRLTAGSLRLPVGRNTTPNRKPKPDNSTNYNCPVPNDLADVHFRHSRVSTLKVDRGTLGVKHSAYTSPSFTPIAGGLFGLRHLTSMIVTSNQDGDPRQHQANDTQLNGAPSEARPKS